MTHFPWDYQGEKGYLKMAVGTFKYLFPQGLPDLKDTLPYTTYQQTAKTYTRHLYAGGPVVTVTRKAKEVKRARSMKATTAESENKLVLSVSGALGASTATVHYTGKVWAVVAWLKNNVKTADSAAIQIRGGKGQAFTLVDPVSPI